jgi:hypothetical protein
MGQFSPRIVRAILHDRRSQLAIGLFIGTFAYSMTVLRELNGKSSGSAQVRGLAVSVDYALIVCAIVTLVLFVHHTAQSIRVGGLIGLVGDETRRQVDRLHPAAREPVPDPDVVPAPEYGVLVKLHHRTLVGLAAQADCLLELVPAMGDFVPRSSPLFRVHGVMRPSLRDAAALGVILGRERTHDFEPGFGIRKLVDIAERSIYSGPFQDPTTSVQAINAIHDVLRRLAVREFPSGVHRDADGQPRLIERMLTWDGYVKLAFDELRLAGAGSSQVARRLRAALEDILTVAPPARRPPLDRQLLLLDAASGARSMMRRTCRPRSYQTCRASAPAQTSCRPLGGPPWTGRTRRPATSTARLYAEPTASGSRAARASSAQELVPQPTGAVSGSSHSGGSTAGVLPGKCLTMRVASRPAGRPSTAGRRSSRLIAKRRLGAICKSAAFACSPPRMPSAIQSSIRWSILGKAVIARRTFSSVAPRDRASSAIKGPAILAASRCGIPMCASSR